MSSTDSLRSVCGETGRELDGVIEGNCNVDGGGDSKKSCPLVDNALSRAFGATLESERDSKALIFDCNAMDGIAAKCARHAEGGR